MKLLVSLVTLLSLIALLELGVRLSNLWVEVPQETLNLFSPSKIEGVNYTFKPNLNHQSQALSFQANSDGLLTRASPKRNECFRIMIFGGSQTAGYGVQSHQSYPAQLEQLLSTSDPSRCFEVINAGQVGYPTHSSVALMRHMAPRYTPDLLILATNKFSMDDASGVSPEGRLVSHGHVAMKHFWLKNEWGHRTKYFDLKKAQKLSQSSSTPNWFKRNILDKSFAYKYFKPKMKKLVSRFKSSSEKTCASCIDLYPVDKGPRHEPWVWPSYSPMYLSPSFQARFYDSINEAISLSEQIGIPLLLFSLDLYIDSARLKKYAKLHIHDLFEATRISPPLFLKKHNLVWDFHANPGGNQLIAQGLLRLLKKKSVVPLSKDSQSQVYESKEYWNRYRAHLKKYENLIFSFIDLGTLQNLHQYIGGPRPGSTEDFQRLSTLLKTKKNSRLKLSGFNTSKDKGQRVQVDIHGSFSTRQTVTLSVGNFETTLEATPHQGLVDIDIRCGESTCSPLSWKRIHFLK